MEGVFWGGRGGEGYFGNIFCRHKKWQLEQNKYSNFEQRVPWVDSVV